MKVCRGTVRLVDYFCSELTTSRWVVDRLSYPESEFATVVMHRCHRHRGANRLVLRFASVVQCYFIAGICCWCCSMLDESWYYLRYSERKRSLAD